MNKVLTTMVASALLLAIRTSTSSAQTRDECFASCAKDEVTCLNEAAQRCSGIVEDINDAAAMALCIIAVRTETCPDEEAYCDAKCLLLPPAPPPPPCVCDTGYACPDGTPTSCVSSYSCPSDTDPCAGSGGAGGSGNGGEGDDGGELNDDAKQARVRVRDAHGGVFSCTPGYPGYDATSCPFAGAIVQPPVTPLQLTAVIASSSDSPAWDGTDTLAFDSTTGDYVFTCYVGDQSQHQFTLGIVATQGQTSMAQFVPADPSNALFGSDGGSFYAGPGVSPGLGGVADCTMVSPGSTRQATYSLDNDPSSSQLITIVLAKATH